MYALLALLADPAGAKERLDEMIRAEAAAQAAAQDTQAAANAKHKDASAKEAALVDREAKVAAREKPVATRELRLEETKREIVATVAVAAAP